MQICIDKFPLKNRNVLSLAIVYLRPKFAILASIFLVVDFND